MIQIIKGTFGYYNGRKVIPITEADGPQKFDDELEARLVKEGVAKYIGELGETAEQPAPAPGDDADEPASTNTAADEAPEYNEDMKLDEPKEVATRYGVDASAMRKKADVIAAIEATKAEQPDDGADDEEPPQKHTVEGKAIAAVLDDNALKERQGGQELSVAESSLLLYAAVEDLPARRPAGEGLNVDGREYIVNDWSEDMGIATVALGQAVTM